MIDRINNKIKELKEVTAEYTKEYSQIREQAKQYTDMIHALANAAQKTHIYVGDIYYDAGTRNWGNNSYYVSPVDSVPSSYTIVKICNDHLEQVTSDILRDRKTALRNAREQAEKANDLLSRL